MPGLKQQRRKTFVSSLILIILAACGIIVGVDSRAEQHCSSVIERSIVNAILNQEYQIAESLAFELELEQAIIPSPAFYRALGTWHNGYQLNDTAIKQMGISALRQSITELQTAFPSSFSPSRESLALGISKGHTARAMLENEQFIAGYEMGMEARQHIKIFRRSSSETDIGYDDTELLLGLFEVYTHDLLGRNQWLGDKINYRGDRENGIDQIENAVNGNSIFAIEAMRALLAEVSWRTPDFCRYTEAVDHIGSEFPRNNDLAVLRQGLLLKCGHVIEAQRANRNYMEQNEYHKAMQDKINKAQFRILADLGDYKTLQRLNTTDDLEPYRQIARANALDVSGYRQQAYEIYQSLSASDQKPSPIKSVAKARLRFPYRPPSKIFTPQFKFNGVLIDGC